MLKPTNVMAGKKVSRSENEFHIRTIRSWRKTLNKVQTGRVEGLNVHQVSITLDPQLTFNKQPVSHFWTRERAWRNAERLTQREKEKVC